MQQMASWKCWLFIVISGTAFNSTPVWSQDVASTNAPTAPTPGADAKTYVNYGLACANAGDLDGAIKAFNAATKIDPNYTEAYYQRGYLEGPKGHLDEAISDFNVTITLDPKFTHAYFYRAFAYSLQGKPDMAVTDYTQAIKLDPNYKDAYYKRGTLMGQRGDFDNAISDFTEVTKLDPKFAPAYYQLGHAEYFKGDLDAASKQLDQALSLDPNAALCYFIRGLVRHAQGNRAEALADFQKSSGFGFPDAAYWVWICEMESNQAVLARKDLTDALSKPESFKPDDWASQVGNFLLEKVTRTDLMNKAKAGGDNDPNGHVCEAWFYIGMHNLLSGDAKEAKDCFTSAVATQSKGSEEFVEANRQLAAPPKP